MKLPERIAVFSMLLSVLSLVFLIVFQSSFWLPMGVAVLAFVIALVGGLIEGGNEFLWPE